MKYDKLVRDRIPEIIEQKGGKCTYRIAGGKEYWEKLKWKLQEEIDEFLEAKNEEELADVYEVVDTILDFVADMHSLSNKKVRALQKKKAEERGRFEKRIILEEA
ncbi:MAG: nucleoside triphosphate pyrophosphohydrolase [bacterium]|nr:nucleoside triphosphate pyrophosphohydrolase [bacterium]